MKRSKFPEHLQTLPEALWSPARLFWLLSMCSALCHLLADPGNTPHLLCAEKKFAYSAHLPNHPASEHPLRRGPSSLCLLPQFPNKAGLMQLVFDFTHLFQDRSCHPPPIRSPWALFLLTSTLSDLTELPSTSSQGHLCDMVPAAGMHAFHSEASPAVPWIAVPGCAAGSPPLTPIPA